MGSKITQLTQWIESMTYVKGNHPASQLPWHQNHTLQGCIREIKKHFTECNEIMHGYMCTHIMLHVSFKFSRLKFYAKNIFCVWSWHIPIYGNPEHQSQYQVDRDPQFEAYLFKASFLQKFDRLLHNILWVALMPISQIYCANDNYNTTNYFTPCACA